MKIIFFGTPKIAIPTLRALLEYENIEVSLVVCQPDKPSGRGKKIQTAPIKEFAQKHNIDVYQPNKLKDNIDAYNKIKELNPDYLVVVAYGKILPETILNIPVYAPINVHFSLLPKYRGAAPVNWSIVKGEELTGVTTMVMDKGLDTGDILLSEKIVINNKDSINLLEELSIVGARLLIDTINNFKNIKPLSQNHNESTFAPMLKKEDGLINWSKDAAEIERLVRGLKPWPGAFSYYKNKSVKFFSVEVMYDHNKEMFPGTVSEIKKDSFQIQCGMDAIKVNELQIEGKRRINVKDFLSGYSLKEGEQFHNKII